jgi:methionyl aminopeptidase
MDKNEIQKIKQAGEIASKTVSFAKTIVKKSMPLLEIVNLIESKIIELGALPAFPVTISINEVAAHATPSYNSEELAHGLIKIDLGIQIDGYIADTAFSIDLDNSQENKKLIAAAEKARDIALDKINSGIPLRQIGGLISQTCEEMKVNVIRNLSGHSIDQYEIHAGITIPNFDNHQEFPLNEGLYAIEPFTTLGHGAVRDGKPSGIYEFVKQGNVRDPFARTVLQYIIENYKSLPFCSRWIHKKFGTRGLLALRQIESAGLYKNDPQLIETSGSNVAQAEHTVLILKNEKIITTR